MTTLRELRRRLYLTQAELAQKVGVSETTIASWEAGRAAPRLRHLRKLADALGVTPQEVEAAVIETQRGKAAAA